MTQPITSPDLTSPAPPAVGLGLPAIPPEVQKFAEEVGAAPYLPGVLAMTREIVPDRPITVQLDCDPSIADDWYITFRVEVGDMTAEQLYAAYVGWTDAFIVRCPAPHRQFFHFGI